jgi:hypothetical protein
LLVVGSPSNHTFHYIVAADSGQGGKPDRTLTAEVSEETLEPMDEEEVEAESPTFFGNGCPVSGRCGWLQNDTLAASVSCNMTDRRALVPDWFDDAATVAAMLVDEQTSEDVDRLIEEELLSSGSSSSTAAVSVALSDLDELPETDLLQCCLPLSLTLNDIGFFDAQVSSSSAAPASTCAAGLSEVDLQRLLMIDTDLGGLGREIGDEFDWMVQKIDSGSTEDRQLMTTATTLDVAQQPQQLQDYSTPEVAELLSSVCADWLQDCDLFGISGSAFVVPSQ